MIGTENHIVVKERKVDHHPVIRVVDLWKDYGNDRAGTPALRGANVEI